jgi:hypothetical protein
MAMRWKGGKSRKRDEKGRERETGPVVNITPFITLKDSLSLSTTIFYI